MKKKKVYLTKIFYSMYTGLFMGFIITSSFLVIITNIDKYFFNSFIGISGDWLYYSAIIVLVPIFGGIYVFNKRIVIDGNMLEVREKSYSFNVSRMDVLAMQSISLHKQKSRRRTINGIKFADGKTAIMLFIKPYSMLTLKKLVTQLTLLNPDIILDEYYINILNPN